MAPSPRRAPKPGAAFTFIASIVRPLLATLCKRDWRGRENVPREGGVIVVANHYSFFDPISLGHFLVCSGRTPRFMAKAGVFKNPVLGRLFKAAGQIPVHRDTREAAHALRDAIAAVERGELVIMYPEGTMTKDPDLWPMAGKSGAARMALRTGAPILPVAQWGAQEVFAPYSKSPKFFPRKTLKVTAGPLIDLVSIVGKEITSTSLAAGTELIMDTLTGMLAEIRGEEPPAVRFDPAAAAQPPAGPAEGTAAPEPAAVPEPAPAVEPESPAASASPSAPAAGEGA
ncbi:MAG TPA: lysophospholipid acyltransferase family protein [Actinocrinis sp.]